MNQEQYYTQVMNLPNLQKYLSKKQNSSYKWYHKSEENKEKKGKQQKEWNDNNKDKIRVYRKDYWRKKRR